MTLQSILSSLSEPVQVTLDKWLTLALLPKDPTPIEVLEAAEAAVFHTKGELEPTPEEALALEQVPGIIVADLFPHLDRGVDW